MATSLTNDPQDRKSWWRRWRVTIGYLILAFGTTAALWQAHLSLEQSRVAQEAQDHDNQQRLVDLCNQSADNRKVISQVIDLSTQSTLPLSPTATPEQRELREANAARVARFMAQVRPLLDPPDCTQGEHPR